MGYLIAGTLMGPNALGVVQNVERMEQITEFGVVFMLFNIGLELSWKKLKSSLKYVFGLGTLQVLHNFSSHC